MIVRRESRTKAIVVAAFSLLIMVPAAIGFVGKLVDFFRTLTSEAGGGFTIVPIMNYLLVTAGFACFLIWAIVHGMFRHVEQPKYDMLDREAELDHLAGLDWPESQDDTPKPDRRAL
jgi:hypothetical protein